MNHKVRTPVRSQQGSSSYHSPRHSQLRCAYHPKQPITNFCKCEECLLPVCPTCIKVHTDEHKINKTTPKFQEIHKVVEQMRDTYLRLSDLVDQIRNYLVEVETSKKQNQSQIRQTMLHHRQILVQQFQQSLVDMENRLMEQIVSADEDFIARIGSMDTQLSNIKFEVEDGLKSLEGEQLLKHIIIHYGKHAQEKYYAQISGIKQNSSELNQNTLSPIIRTQEIKTIQRAIEKYLRLEGSNIHYNNKISNGR